MDLSSWLSATPTSKIATRFQTRFPEKLRHRLAYRVLPDFWVAKKLYNAPKTSNYELQSTLQKNCIFIHIPKSAGISVAKAIYGSRAGGHLPVSYYLWLFGARYFDQFFKFTFVRNPEDRALSAYKFLSHGGLNSDDSAWADQHVKPYESFDKFVSESLIKPEVFNAVHFHPQVTYLLDPRSGRIAVDFIGRFENIEESFNDLRSFIDTEGDLPHENRTKYNEKEKISLSTTNILRKIYKKDFNLLAY